ncbi:MAG: ECF-type sigma factor [Gemmataceae bacterium]
MSLPSQSQSNSEDGQKRLNADELLPKVYDELRKLAAIQLAVEKPGHTLQPTALVHEAYLRLAEAGAKWEGSIHFYRAAAESMRRILVDSARKQGRKKRGGGKVRQAIDLEQWNAPEDDQEVIDLHEGLTVLATIEPQIAELVSLRYFAGLTLKEAAELIGFSPRTADSYWAYARAWLVNFLKSDELQAGHPKE